MAKRQSVPVYLNLFRMHFPVGAVTSIAHRCSGVILFVALPLTVYLLDLSLRDAAGFEQASMILQQVWARFALALVVWSLFHHLFAGIRFLLIDLEVGVSRQRARLSARLVNAAALLAAFLFLGYLS